MQRNISPNTFRDSNELSSNKQTILLPPSESSTEPMDVDHNSHHSIVRSVDNNDHSSSTRIDSPRRTLITNRPLVKSIVRSNDNDRLPPEPSEARSNETLVNNDNRLSQAAGFDPKYIAAIDADEAFARELQEQEYARDSIFPVQHHYERFRIPSDGDPLMENSSHDFDSETIPHFENDEDYAAYLQAQEDRQRERFHRRPISFFPIPTRPTPTSESNERENIVVPPSPMHRRPLINNDDDEDDNEGIHLTDAQAFFHYLANQHFGPGGIPPFIFNSRRNYRRTGNLQDTEEDFGPEDYERLLQLDDGIRKKKLSQHQINTIQEIAFHSNSKNTDEENKCGVCLELFEENQNLRQFPCLHAYHKACADRWLRENNVCPICRKPPVDIQSTSSSRHRHQTHHRSSNNNNNNTINNSSRRLQTSHRNSTNRQTSTSSNSTTTTTSNSTNSTNHYRRAPPSQRPS